ncbi:MAG: SUMF1/EgtB/PvdO family nonheme iron enzyme [Bacteroidales bacterium]|nr:SUMF1/EgtB/PvdO family nonheme iron enzyme [Bacteroidales bacterium]
MKKSDKTKTYSNENKTTTYGDSGKLTKETIHNLKAGENIILNNKDYKILEIISESTGEAVIYKIESVTPKSPKGDFAAATKKSPSGDLGAKQAKANFNQKQKIYALKLYFEFKDLENEPNTEALSRIKNIKDVDILRLYDFGTGINKYENKYCFEILDFAHGLDLLDVKKLKEKYSPDFIEKEVIPQIFLGILKLHENRIYHCDLKPQNVFYLDKTQVEIVVGDYGSAKTFEFDAEKKSRKTTTVKGTDFYLPPEQARGFISEKNDYYSFGMILLHLFYPEKILLNESEPKSLSHSKLKQIIERQFEAKPIIDFNPKYERINKLIEGLTLVDFNLRWGKEQVEQWIKGEQIEVIYRKSAETQSGTSTLVKKALKFGKYTINTPYDLRDYILNDPNWYTDLIEDKENKEDFIIWILNLYDGNRSKRSAFNRIIKYYSPEGIDFVADAIIRFLIPEHPVVFGLKMFDFKESTDLIKTTTEAFSHLIFNLWENSSDKDIQLYFFRYEFALRQLKDKQPEVINLLNILYKELNKEEKISDDFYNYKVFAYTSVSKKALQNIKQFLYESLLTQSILDFIELNDKNELHYSIGRTLNSYFSEIGINNSLTELGSPEIISVSYPKDYNSLENFYEKTIDAVINSICNKHSITAETFSENSLELFKRNFINAFNSLSEKLANEYYKIKKDLSIFIKWRYPINNYIKKIKLTVKKKKYNEINSAFYLISKIRKYENDKLIKKKQRIEKFISPKKSAITEFYKENRYITIMSLAAFLLTVIILLSKLYEKKEAENIVFPQVEMIRVWGGEFNMGYYAGPENKKPLHTIYLNSFYISKYEITNKQFCLFLNDYGYKVKDKDNEKEKTISYSNNEERDWGIHRTDSGWHPAAGYENHPVIYVTWYGANEFCKWIGGRLPTEAEWEFAVRGGNKSEAYKYSGSNELKDIAWYNDNSENKTHKVGTKSPNELGIHDMSGNVFEWCEDWYKPNNKPVNLTEAEAKVLRGGSYYSDNNKNSLFYRTGHLPNKSFSNIGFRLCSDKELNN